MQAYPEHLSLPVAQRAMNVCACFRIKTNLSLGRGSFRRMCSMKSCGVTAARFHFNFPSTTSSHSCRGLGWRRQAVSNLQKTLYFSDCNYITTKLVLLKLFFFLACSYCFEAVYFILYSPSPPSTLEKLNCTGNNETWQLQPRFYSFCIVLNAHPESLACNYILTRSLWSFPSNFF